MYIHINTQTCMSRCMYACLYKTLTRKYMCTYMYVYLYTFMVHVPICLRVYTRTQAPSSLHVGRCVKVVIPGTQNKVAVTIQVSIELIAY